MRYKKENLKDVPNTYNKIRQVVLEDINDIYVLLETGEIWSRASGQFLKKYPQKGGMVVLTKNGGGTIDTTISYLLRKYFKFDEIFKNIEYKPILGLDNKYLALADGRIYSCAHHKFLKNSTTQTGWNVVCLTDLNGKRFSAFPAKLVYEAFNGPIEKGYVVTFKDGNKSNNNINNLDIKLRYKNIKE